MQEGKDVKNDAEPERWRGEKKKHQCKKATPTRQDAQTKASVRRCEKQQRQPDARWNVGKQTYSANRAKKKKERGVTQTFPDVKRNAGTRRRKE